MEREEEGPARTDDIASRGTRGGEAGGGQRNAGATYEQPGSAGTEGLAPPGAATPQQEESTPLLPDREASEFDRRWHDLQVNFIDEPQRCVQDADALVAEVMQRLADSFAEERKNLEAQWAGGGEASTEDLRVALQRYRSFFNRLLRQS
jgi:hypothetical protein